MRVYLFVFTFMGIGYIQYIEYNLVFIFKNEIQHFVSTYSLFKIYCVVLLIIITIDTHFVAKFAAQYVTISHRRKCLCNKIFLMVNRYSYISTWQYQHDD